MPRSEVGGPGFVVTWGIYKRAIGHVVSRQVGSRLVATIAHDAIFEMRRDLIGQYQGGPEQAQLLAESARVVTVDLPAISATTRQLPAMWKEQSVLDE